MPAAQAPTLSRAWSGRPLKTDLWRRPARLAPEETIPPCASFLRSVYPACPDPPKPKGKMCLKGKYSKIVSNQLDWPE